MPPKRRHVQATGPLCFRRPRLVLQLDSFADWLDKRGAATANRERVMDQVANLRSERRLEELARRWTLDEEEEVVVGRSTIGSIRNGLVEFLFRQCSCESWKSAFVQHKHGGPCECRDTGPDPVYQCSVPSQCAPAAP